MVRPSNPRKIERLMSLPGVDNANPELAIQTAPMFVEPKGIDRFHSSSRVGPEHAVKIRNFMFDDGVLTSRLGTDLMGGNAASTVVQVVDLVKEGQEKITIRFCTRHIEIFEYGMGAWNSFPVPLTGTENDFFAYTGWASKLLFSNGIDGLWEFDFRTMIVKLVPEGPSAKHLTTFGQRVVACSTVENAEDYPLRVRWSANRDYTRWKTADDDPTLTPDLAGGFEDLYGAPGGITDEAMAVIPYSDTQAWLVRSRSVYVMATTGNVLAPFRFDVTLDRVGTPYRNTIVSIPAGVIFASREDIHLLTTSAYELIGQTVIDEILDEVSNLKEAYAAYDSGRGEYRLAIETLVWRYRFPEKGWTCDEYPFPIKSLSRQIQGFAGIPIDSLQGTIDELIGRIDELVYDRYADDAMMFVPRSTELTVRETDDPRDTLLTGEETDSELILETGVVNLNPLKAIELHGIHAEYESQMLQQLIFELSVDDGAFWFPYSLKDIEETLGSEMLFADPRRWVDRNIRIRLRAITLGKLRLLGMAPALVQVERHMAPRKPKPSAISVLPSPLALSVGGTQPLSIQVLGPNGVPITGYNVTLVSSNSNIATVSSTGLVRAIAPGTFAIVASVRNIQVSVSGQVTAAAPAPVATITITPSISQGAAGTQQQFTATLRDANGNILLGRTVTWSSSAPTFATINSAGLATLVAAGATIISATSEGVTAGVSLTVTAAPAVVVTVTVAPSTFSGDAGTTVQLVATPRDSGGNALSGKVISWSTSAPLIATVNATGLVSLLSAGSVTITATCETIPGTSAGTVTPADMPVSTVTVAPTSFTKAAGQTQALTATLRDVNGIILTGRVVDWSSSNTSVATVNGSGLVTAVAAGTATITALSEGKIGTSAATVTAVPVATVTVNPTTFSLNAGQSAQLVATARDAGGNVLTGRVFSWGSSNVTVASVSQTGLVTAIAVGSVTITATCETIPGTSTGTISAGSFSSVASNSGVLYVPEPNPAGALASLPTLFFETSYGKRAKTGAAVTFASTVTLTASGNRDQDTTALQTAIDAAGSRAGNSKIILPNNFIWDIVQAREHTLGDYVTYLEAQALPSVEFTRANTASMTLSPNGRSTVNGMAIQFDRKAKGYRFVGLRFTAVPKTTTSIIYHLMFVTPRESSQDFDTDIANINEDIVFDRCWFEGNDAGTGVDTGNVRDGAFLNGRWVAVVDSVIEKIGSTGNESHGILITNTPGPIKIVNNKIEATSIGMLVGGDTPHFGAAAGRPGQIEIRHNRFTRRLQWAKDDALWDGISGRGIKNLLEFKNVNGVLVEGNIFENNWADGQSGMALIVKAASGGTGSAAGQGSENVTIRHNIVRNSVRCWNFAALGDELDALQAKKAVLFNNLAYDIGQFAGQNEPTIAWLITQTFDDLYINHNTTIINNAANTMQLAYAEPSNKSERFVFKNNITAFAYVWADGILGQAGIESWAAPGYSWVNNVLIMDSANWGIHPGAPNQFVALLADVQFENVAADNYRLAAGSPFNNDADDGTDPGCDVDKVELATAGV